MTKKEYILATNLERIRLAGHLLNQLLVGSGIKMETTDIIRSLNDLEGRVFDRLYKKLNG